LVLYVPQATHEQNQLAAGQVITATPRPYGTEFARAEKPFFLVLHDAWFDELQTKARDALKRRAAGTMARPAGRAGQQPRAGRQPALLRRPQVPERGAARFAVALWRRDQGRA
jgi:hypothetical protein